MSAQQANAYPVGCKVPTRIEPVSPLVRDWIEEGNCFSLSSLTNLATGEGHEEAGCNMCEPRSSLVNTKMEETTLYLNGEVSNFYCETGMVEIPLGVSGTTRLEGKRWNWGDPRCGSRISL